MSNATSNVVSQAKLDEVRKMLAAAGITAADLQTKAAPVAAPVAPPKSETEIEKLKRELQEARAALKASESGRTVKPAKPARTITVAIEETEKYGKLLVFSMHTPGKPDYTYLSFGAAKAKLILENLALVQKLAAEAK